MTKLITRLYQCPYPPKKNTFLTDCKDTGNLDIVTYSNILYQLGEDNMERIKYYMERLAEHHGDMREFLDKAKKDAE